MDKAKRKIKILAIASTGGHWLQLLRLRPAFSGCQVTFISTADYQQHLHETQYKVRDANQWDKIGLFIMAIQILFLTLKIRPDVIVSTGAAPGFFALMFGKIMGKKTVWIDSIANGEEMSLAGKKVKRFADLYLTQWPNLETINGPKFKGTVL